MRTRRLAACRVLDRGPYGARLRGRFVLKLRPTQRGTWRSVVDLSPAVAGILGMKENGSEPVRLIYPAAYRGGRPGTKPSPGRGDLNRWSILPAGQGIAAPWPLGPLGWL